ncbi:MAG: DUF423 domain-containing protein [Flavobacterium sp.]
MSQKVISVAAVLGMIAIILGAFGAHALKKMLPVEALVIFETGVRYQMYHALFLLFIGTTTLVSDITKKYTLYLTTVGVLFFSGSLYILATKMLTNIDFAKIGFITPIGGLLLIIAWGLLLFDFFKINKKKNNDN